MIANKHQVEAMAAADIEELVARLLRDLGNPEPPLRLEDVRALQKLDLTYYSKADLNLLDEIAHRTVMAGHTIVSTAKCMYDVVTKVGLKGLINKGQRCIYIDKEVVDKKRRFILAHEITHDLLPWHRSLLLGDNEETLSPRCYQVMEAEANFGGRELIFMGSRFTTELRDNEVDWKVIGALGKAYGNTMTTTLWQTILRLDPATPTFGMISRHPYHADIGKRAGNADVAYFIRSDSFLEQFGHVSDAQAYAAMRSYVWGGRKGPMGEDVCLFTNSNGESCEFHMTSFSNQYDLLTLGRFKRVHQSVIGF